jgi:hypothetical protein
MTSPALTDGISYSFQINLPFSSQPFTVAVVRGGFLEASVTD